MVGVKSITSSTLHIVKPMYYLNNQRFDIMIFLFLMTSYRSKIYKVCTETLDLATVWNKLLIFDVLLNTHTLARIGQWGYTASGIQQGDITLECQSHRDITVMSSAIYNQNFQELGLPPSHPQEVSRRTWRGYVFTIQTMISKHHLEAC